MCEIVCAKCKSLADRIELLGAVPSRVNPESERTRSCRSQAGAWQLRVGPTGWHPAEIWSTAPNTNAHVLALALAHAHTRTRTNIYTHTHTHTRIRTHEHAKVNTQTHTLKGTC
jgi:hypothetical protein